MENLSDGKILVALQICVKDKLLDQNEIAEILIQKNVNLHSLRPDQIQIYLF